MPQRDRSAGKKAVRARSRVRKRKPAFVRPESWRYTRLNESWRKPRGLDHKIRRRFKGWPAGVRVGYRGPKSARALHPSGYREVLIYNSEQLKGIDAKTQAARIAHTVGKRNRARILADARKKRILVLNLKQVKEVAEKEVVEEKEEKAEETEGKEEKEAMTETEEPKREKKARKPKEEEKIE